MKIEVLDQGYVMLKDWMGSDLSPVNDARVSFNKQTDTLRPQDIRLIHFLAEHDHTSPFRHSFLKFEIYAPLMVARQWYKYLVGSDHAEQPLRYHDPFFAWNESSRRYITEEPRFYVVAENEWRSAPENRKQGSGEPLPVEIGRQLTWELIRTYEQGLEKYERALKMGVAPEQARLFLSAYGMYIRWIWTASLQAVAHLLNQRLAEDAQWEFRQYAKAVYILAHDKFPNAIEALVKVKPE